MKNFWHRWKHLFFAISIIFLLLVIASVFDIVIAALNGRFYSNVVFVVLFGVAGIFASFVSYINGIDLAPAKTEGAKWSIIISQLSIGLLFFFLLSEIEGGEYRTPFKAFGICLALSSCFFMKGKP